MQGADGGSMHRADGRQMVQHGDKHHHLSPGNEPAVGDDVAEHSRPAVRGNRGKGGGRKRNNQFRERHRQQARQRRDKKDDQAQRKGRGGGNKSGLDIREAIHNIDKVFLDNRPKAAATVVQKKKRRGEGGGRGQSGKRNDNGGAAGASDDALFPDDDAAAVDAALAGGDGGDNVLPVVHADDDGLPANAEALDEYAYGLPASEALECRASVIQFVIYATDVKDECDGLRKAFDKTCSVAHGAAAGGGGDGGSGAIANPASAGAGVHRSRRLEEVARNVGRERLSERGRPHLWNLIPGAFYDEARRAGRRVESHLRRRLSERNVVHVDRLMRSNRTLQAMNTASEYAEPGGKMIRRGMSTEGRKMEEVDLDAPGESQPVQQQQQQPQKQQPKQEQHQAPPLISLNIPTANKHISEQMLNDALLLQKSSDLAPTMNRASATSLDKVQQELPPPPQQQQKALHDAPEENAQDQLPQPAVNVNPNRTEESAAAIQDAAESAEAIRTAVEGVEGIMNDPKSVEARTCCASILSVFHEHCDPTTTGVEDYSDRRLLVVVFVITVCGMVKSLIRHLGIRWLPEAGGCILVGVFGYLILQHYPHVQFAFDGDMFLRIMVPPIVFEAAVKINKRNFLRHVVPITIFAVAGTLASTAFTALFLHKGSSLLSDYVTVIPVKESLVFGALISSIDPIAVLSVLNNMGMTDSDTVYVLIFGESLLNDGVAIVLFQTLVHFLDDHLVVDADVIFDASVHFGVVALGSVTVGMLSGACATVYFALMHGCQTPMVEVIMFCCWSYMPYYVCDMVEWSGIVAIVANGFVMDLYVIGQHGGSGAGVATEDDILMNGTANNSNSARPRQHRQNQCRAIFNYEGHLSTKAESHVHFVIEIFATLMETAIFAYLGLFLFSSRYHWSGYLTVISIFATVTGRVIMIPLFSHIANILNRMGLSRRRSSASSSLGNSDTIDRSVYIDRRMQLVLIFAGLRGAMSFALVEHIPMFDATTGQGSRLKPELKAMTSASVIFTVFVLGGATSYLMERLGYSLGSGREHDAVEIAPLMPQRDKKMSSPAAADRRNGMFSSLASDTSNSITRISGSVRQRGGR